MGAFGANRPIIDGEELRLEPNADANARGLWCTWSQVEIPIEKFEGLSGHFYSVSWRRMHPLFGMICCGAETLVVPWEAAWSFSVPGLRVFSNVYIKSDLRGRD